MNNSSFMSFLFTMLAIACAAIFIVANLTYRRDIERKLDNCQMICHQADAEVHALKIQKKILERQVRMLKDLIPTNVTLKIELSDIIEEADKESRSSGIVQ